VTKFGATNLIESAKSIARFVFEKSSALDQCRTSGRCSMVGHRVPFTSAFLYKVIYCGESRAGCVVGIATVSVSHPLLIFRTYKILNNRATHTSPSSFLQLPDMAVSAATALKDVHWLEYHFDQVVPFMVCFNDGAISQYKSSSFVRRSSSLQDDCGKFWEVIERALDASEESPEVSSPK
jgi:hypothetical protein